MVVWRWFCGLFLCWFRGCYKYVVRLFCGGLRAVVWWLSRVEDGAAENGGGSRSCREEEKELKWWKKGERPCVRELRGAALFFPLFPGVSQKHILLPLFSRAFLPFKIEWIGWLVNFLHNYCASSPPLFFVFSLLLSFVPISLGLLIFLLLFSHQFVRSFIILHLPPILFLFVFSQAQHSKI
jgi:hypothetical protein